MDMLAGRLVDRMGRNDGNHTILKRNVAAARGKAADLRVLVALLFSLMLVRPAAADVAVSIGVQVARRGAAVIERTVRVFVQGDHVRMEDGSNTVILCDTRGEHVYRLDLGRKTFHVEDSLDRDEASLSDRLRRADSVRVKVTVAPRDEKRTVAGLETRGVAVKGEWSVDIPTASGGGLPQGGMQSPAQSQRPGLGIPMGGGSADDGVESQRPRDLRLDGEYWFSDDPSVAVLERSAGVRRLVYIRTLPDPRLPQPLLRALLQRLEREGAHLPIASRITLVEIDPTVSIDAGDPGRPLQTITTAVTEIQTAPLDRMLFIVPADFHRGE